MQPASPVITSLKCGRRMWKFFVLGVLFAQFPAGAEFKWNCMHHSVVEYLNISSENKLLLYTRPKKDWREALDIELDFTLVSILTVVEKLQVITTYFWLYVAWRNDFVSWNPSDFCNITHLTLPADKFWVPELSVEEQANEDKSKTSPFLQVFSNGTIMQFQSFHLTSSCSLHIYTFPFDKQICNITILSPMHSDQEVRMRNTHISLEVDTKSRNTYLTNGEWKFNRIRFFEETMSGQEMNYSAVTYQLFMQRRPVLYVLNLIIPTSALFLLDLVISCTSASSAEKINLKITLILEIAVLSLILNEILPTSSDDPPVIAKFFMGIFLLLVASLLENYLTASLKIMEPPPWFLKCERLLCFQRKKKTSDDPEPHPEEVVQKQEEPSGPLPADKGCEETEAYAFLRSICDEVKLMREHLSAERSEIPINAKWNEFMLRVEKLFCYTRLCFSILFITYIILKWKGNTP